MANDGKAAEKAFEDYWRKRGHLERFPDQRDLMGLNQGRRVADFPKPSDYIVSSRADPLHYAEVKSTTSKTRFSFSKIRPKQSEAALKSAKRGDRGYIFYIFSYHLSRWFVMTACEYADAVSAGARSIPFSELTEWQM